MSYSSTKLIPGLVVTLSETPEVDVPHVLVWDTHLNEINRVNNKQQIRNRAEVRHLQANWWESKSLYRNKTQLRYLIFDLNPKTRFPKNFKSLVVNHLTSVSSLQHLSTAEHRRASAALRHRHLSQEPTSTEPNQEVLVVLSYGFVNAALRFNAQQQTCCFEHTVLVNYDHVELNSKEFPTTDMLLVDAARNTALDYLTFFNSVTDELLTEANRNMKRRITRSKGVVTAQETMEL